MEQNFFFSGLGSPSIFSHRDYKSELNQKPQIKPTSYEKNHNIANIDLHWRKELQSIKELWIIELKTMDKYKTIHLMMLIIEGSVSWDSLVWFAVTLFNAAICTALAEIQRCLGCNVICYQGTHDRSWTASLGISQ